MDAAKFPTTTVTNPPPPLSGQSVGEDGEPSTVLATFDYSATGPPLQRFPAARSERAVSSVELRVSSNWGHPEYTCLYRFRVHGEPGVEGEEGGR